jgi:hypothetical protein
MALTGGDSVAGEGFPGRASRCRDTTHARFGSEVEWNASNLVALLPAQRSLELVWQEPPKTRRPMPRSRFHIADLGSVRQHVASSKGG